MVSFNLMCGRDVKDMEQVSGNSEIGMVFRCPKCKNEVILSVEK